MMSSILEQGVLVLGGVPSYLRIIKTNPAIDNEGLKSIEAFSKISEDTKRLVDQFDDQINFRINAHSMVGIWAAIEAMIENLIANHLIKGLPQTDLLASRFLGLNAKHLSHDAIRLDPYRTSQTLERHVSKSANDIVDIYTDLLSKFDVVACPDSSKKRDFIELSQVRNLLMHRGGIVDQKFKNHCPWVALEPGEQYLVERNTYLRFFDAASDFVQSILRAACVSPYLTRSKG